MVWSCIYRRQIAKTSVDFLLLFLLQGSVCYVCSYWSSTYRSVINALSGSLFSPIRNICRSTYFFFVSLYLSEILFLKFALMFTFFGKITFSTTLRTLISEDWTRLSSPWRQGSTGQWSWEMGVAGKFATIEVGYVW